MRRAQSLAGLLALAVALAMVVPAAFAADAPPPKRRSSLTESFILLDTVPAAIVRNGAPSGLLLVDFGLDIPDPDGREAFEAALPRYRDIYVRVLSAYASMAGSVVRPPDVAAIAQRLQIATDRALGPGKARVLLMGVAVRRTR